MKKLILTFALCAVYGSMCAAAEVTTDTVYIDGDHSRLFAVVQRPVGVVSNDVVVFSHGFMGDHHYPLFSMTASRLHDAGVATVMFDFNGHGQSEGDFQQMTVPNEVVDLTKVVDWTKSQPWSKKVSLVGHSQGGVVSGLVAGTLGAPSIDRLVLLAPAAVLRDDALKGSTMGGHFHWWEMKDTDYIPLNWGPVEKRLGSNYIKEAVHLPIYEITGQFTGPAFIIHGMHDEVVPYTYGERYRVTLPNASLRLEENADHGLMDRPADYAEAIASFLLAD